MSLAVNTDNLLHVITIKYYKCYYSYVEIETTYYTSLPVNTTSVIIVMSKYRQPTTRHYH